MRMIFQMLILVLACLLSFSISCGCADDDDIDNNNDNNGDDDDSDSAQPLDSSPSFNFGIVHFHYYGDLGGNDGQIFLDDQAWVASNIELAIIGQSDEGSVRAWEEISANDPRGLWLNWEAAHLFNTNETAGDCDNPSVGEPDQSYAQHIAQLADFLEENPSHGDGESCFLHARNDGTMISRWHAAGCDVEIFQLGLDGGAENLTQARIRTLVWDEYAWLLDMSGDCARDFTAWKVRTMMADTGRSGAGFDNIGGPLDDGYYLPLSWSDIDVMEIEDATEEDENLLNEWWYETVDGFIAAVIGDVRATWPEARLLFNGASYCSWDGSIALMERLAHERVGVWCENAIHYPDWGNQSTPDRLAALIELSKNLEEIGSFLVLETFYNGGSDDPTPDEAQYYFALFLVMQNPDDVLVIKPSWNPYSPLEDVTWFPMFARNFGSPDGPATQAPDGIFTRTYSRANGQETLVLVRADGDNGAASFDLDGDWCRVRADDSLSPVSGTISVGSGDGFILIKKGSNACP